MSYDCSYRSYSCCCHGVSRRKFVKSCGAAVAAAGGLTRVASLADEPKGKRARIALVFMSRRKNSWPFPGFDARGREKEILNLLKEGCPQVEFIPIVIQSSDDEKKAIAMKDDVDGYLPYFVTLSWSLVGLLRQIGKLGKPMIVADDFLGGSGAFLCGYSGLLEQNTPAGAVSSTRPDDLVAVARCFADVKKPGTTPASFAKRCWEVYRETFPKVGEMTCTEDKLNLADISECVKELKKSRFLIVGLGHEGREQEFLGTKGIYVGINELKALYDKVDRDKAKAWSGRWSNQAEKIVEFSAKPEWIDKAAALYLAMLELFKKYGVDTITGNCLGVIARSLAYPCLGYMQMLNDGALGVCEPMPDDTLSMLMARILTGRPGYVSDPALDTSKNRIVYSHCTGTTKVFGPKGPSNEYRIMTSHHRDPRSACVRSLMPSGYMTTSFRTNFGRKEMVIHQAKSVGNFNSARGCRTQLIGEVHGDIGRLFDQWAGNRNNWHRVTVFGDVKEPLIEFGKALGLKIIEEA